MTGLAERDDCNNLQKITHSSIPVKMKKTGGHSPEVEFSEPSTGICQDVDWVWDRCGLFYFGGI